jgi:hypothetical protein
MARTKALRLFLDEGGMKSGVRGVNAVVAIVFLIA